MEPRVSLINLGVLDLPRAVWFYRDGMGLPLSSASGEQVAFFRTGGVVLALHPRRMLAADARIPARGSGFGGITIAHNARTRAEVDSILVDAIDAGATLLKPGMSTEWGGYSGYFADLDGHPWEVTWNPLFPIGPDGSLELPE